MKASGLSEFSDIGFLFIDLKENYAELDKELKKGVDWLERAVIRVCTSHKELEDEIEELFPKLFSLRIKALNRMAQEGESMHALIKETLPVIEMIGANAKLKTLISNISKVISANGKLVKFIESAGQLSKENIEAVKDLDYKSYIVVVQYMPSQLRRIISELTTASLSIEFLSIAAFMIYESKFEASGNKILQLTKFSKKIAGTYLGLAELLLRIAQQENLSVERDNWMQFGSMNMSKAYSDDEPDISHLKLREPNPDYNPN